MLKVEGAGRRSDEWTTVNKTDNKVNSKFCNALISAKIERMCAHISKCKKQEVTSRLNSNNDSETSNVIEMLKKKRGRVSYLWKKITCPESINGRKINV